MASSPKFVFGSVMLLKLFALICSVRGESIEWLDAMGNSLSVLRLLEPVGDEGMPSHLYICRGYRDNRWSPGKLYMSKTNFNYGCGYAEGKEYTHRVGDKNNLQVMVAPAGWTSWVPVTDRYNLPPRPISGGTHYDGAQAYVCRIIDDAGRIIPGKYHERDGKCYYAYYGQKWADSSMEVLTINMFGNTVQRATARNITSQHLQ